MLALGRRATLRASQNAGPGPAPWGRRAPGQATRQNCRLSKPRRAGKAAEGDGISHKIEYSGLWGAITTFPRRRPYATNIIIATVKTSAADLIVQQGEGKDKFDWDRNAVFTMFGFAYLGVVQWFVYVTVFTRLCPNAIRFSNMSWADKLKDKAGQKDLFKQVFYDNFVHYTFVYYPVFYTFKELINSREKKEITLWSTFTNGLANYKNNCVKDNLAIWALWVPGDLGVYACPIWMRLPLNHSISFVWTMILSVLRGNEK